MDLKQTAQRVLLNGWSRSAGRTKLGRQVVFRYMHWRNHWGAAESVSGPGSTLDETSAFRLGFVEFCRSRNIKTIADVPCGDAYWMRQVDVTFDRYYGLDIVPKLVADLRQDPPIKNATFAVADMVSSRPPQVDLLLSRDSFIHLPNEDVLQAINNMVLSGSTYLMTNTYPGVGNEQIPTGRWRPIDLQSAPFNFPEPIELIDEESKLTPGKKMGVWDLSRLSQQGEGVSGL